MKNKKWKKFEKLLEKCYFGMLEEDTDRSCWEQAFAVLKEIVLEERQTDPGYARQLEVLEEITDYEYGIQGWIEDCLDEFNARKDPEAVLELCEGLLHLFDWPEYADAEIRFQKVYALLAIGRIEEAEKYSREWVAKEPENVIAATAGVYSLVAVKDYAEAETLVDRFIFDRTDCSGANDIMFVAASKLYGAMGRTSDKQQIDETLEIYDSCYGQYFDDDEDDEELDFGFLDDDELDFGMPEDELPLY